MVMIVDVLIVGGFGECTPATGSDSDSGSECFNCWWFYSETSVLQLLGGRDTTM